MLPALPLPISPPLPLHNMRERWRAACGTRPSLKRWKSMRGADKFRLLHKVAELADAETLESDYFTSYMLVDIDDVISQKTWSVEHVVPRSRTGDNTSARNDPNGWIVATRVANSTRSNLPLLLWDGEASGHFAPPLKQRARLARKWLFVRATYSGLDLPSKAQRNNMWNIINLVKKNPPDDIEVSVNRIYREMLGWSNPLIDDQDWLDDIEWVKNAFSVV